EVVALPPLPLTSVPAHRARSEVEHRSGRINGVSEPAGFGVYLHVPFCRHRCDYCAFATWTDRLELADRYLAACRTQVEQAVAEGMGPVTSVFVGGGTPTLAPPDALLRVLHAV